LSIVVLAIKKTYEEVNIMEAVDMTLLIN